MNEQEIQTLRDKKRDMREAADITDRLPLSPPLLTPAISTGVAIAGTEDALELISEAMVILRRMKAQTTPGRGPNGHVQRAYRAAVAILLEKAAESLGASRDALK